MSELVIPVGRKGDRLKLEDSGGVLVASITPPPARRPQIHGPAR